MILGDRKSRGAQPDGQTTLDGLFRRTAARKPDALALADPPNREAFTEGRPRRLTYAQTDRIVSAIADRLRRLAPKSDTVVGVMLPHTVESVLVTLGIVRAGLIAAPLPLLWRRADAVAALSRIGVKIIVTASRADGYDLCDLAMQVAAEIFPVRYVCSFGTGLPDGVIPLDDLMLDRAIEEPPDERGQNPALHVAAVTWDITPGGAVPVARNQPELIAGGLAALLEGGIAPDASILSCCPASTFGGLALSIVPWLLSGGVLSLHHGFDPDTFAAQCRDQACDTLAVPGPLVTQLAEAGLLAHPALRNVLAIWRAPERLMTSPAWQHPTASLTDMLVFGETAVLGSRRGADGLPTPLPAHHVSAPRGSGQAMLLAEPARTPAGTLALRGPMVPHHAFPPGAERLSEPHFRTDSHGFADTGYSCRVDSDAGTLLVTGPPPGTISVGGYRFVMSELEALVRQTDSTAMLTALPDVLAGHRLAGVAGDADALRAALAARGVNPLVTDAFAARRPPQAA